jgi:Tol biopolymer transport system component
MRLLLPFAILLLLAMGFPGCRSNNQPAPAPEELAVLLPQVAGFPLDGKVSLSWGWIWWGSNQSQAEGRPDAFRIMIGSSLDSTLREIALVSGQETTYEVPQLVNRQIYYFAIEAMLDNRPSVRSNVIAVAPGRWIDPSPVFTDPVRNRFWGSWSGDGQSLAYATDNQPGEEGSAIFSYHLPTSTETYRGSGTQPHWQRYHDQIAFVTDLVLNRAAPDTSATYLALMAQNQASVFLGGDASYLQPIWSPDGRRLAYLRQNSDAQFDLYQTIISNPPMPIRLTFGFGELVDLPALLDRSAQHTSWHPTEASIAYDRFAPKTDTSTAYAKDIFQVSTDMPGAEVALVSSPWEDQTPAFSPDGQKLAYFSDRSGVPGIWLKDLSTGRDRQLYGGTTPTVDVQHGRLAWSPQGDRLLFNAWANDSITSLYLLQVSR